MPGETIGPILPTTQLTTTETLSITWAGGGAFNAEAIVPVAYNPAVGGTALVMYIIDGTVINAAFAGVPLTLQGAVINASGALIQAIVTYEDPTSGPTSLALFENKIIPVNSPPYAAQ